MTTDPTIDFASLEGESLASWLVKRARGEAGFAPSVAHLESPEDVLVDAWASASIPLRSKLEHAFVRALSIAASADLTDEKANQAIQHLASLAERTESRAAASTLRALAERTALGDRTLSPAAAASVLHALATLQPTSPLLSELWQSLWDLEDPWLSGLALTALARTNHQRALSLLSRAAQREEKQPFGLGETLWALANDPIVGRDRLMSALSTLPAALLAVCARELREVGGEELLPKAKTKRKAREKKFKAWFQTTTRITAPPRLVA